MGGDGRTAGIRTRRRGARLDRGIGGTMNDFTVYSNGLWHCSVCTTLSPEEATNRVNLVNPTGTSGKWAITEPAFNDGTPNPCPCNDWPETHIHILFTC